MGLYFGEPDLKNPKHIKDFKTFRHSLFMGMFFSALLGLLTLLALIFVFKAT